MILSFKQERNESLHDFIQLVQEQDLSFCRCYFLNQNNNSPILKARKSLAYLPMISYFSCWLTTLLFSGCHDSDKFNYML